MRRYETVFILRPDQGEAQVKEGVQRFEQIVSSGGGELVETDEWGIRDLAYNIKRERRGYYVRLDYVATAAVVNELERNLRIADHVLRYLSVQVSDESNAAELRSEVEARKRKIAESRAAAAAAAAERQAPPSEPAPAEAEPKQPEQPPENSSSGSQGGADQS